jgi:hypothetical protein
LMNNQSSGNTVTWKTEDNIKIDLREMSVEDATWMEHTKIVSNGDLCYHIEFLNSWFSYFRLGYCFKNNLSNV